LDLAAVRKNELEGTMQRFTVLLGDDHLIVREGFKKLLELNADQEVIGQPEDEPQAVALAKKLPSAGFPRIRSEDRAQFITKLDIHLPLVSPAGPSIQVSFRVR
jgi:DNA-binding NarL/FixJ family response regulator